MHELLVIVTEINFPILLEFFFPKIQIYAIYQYMAGISLGSLLSHHEVFEYGKNPATK